MSSLSDFLDRLEMLITSGKIIISQGVLVGTRLRSRPFFRGFRKRFLPKLCLFLLGQGDLFSKRFLLLQFLTFKFGDTSILDGLTIARPAIVWFVGLDQFSIFDLAHQEAEESRMATGKTHFIQLVIVLHPSDPHPGFSSFQVIDLVVSVLVDLFCN